MSTRDRAPRPHTTRLGVWPIVLVVVILATACGGGTDDDTAATTLLATPVTSAASPATTVAVTPTTATSTTTTTVPPTTTMALPDPTSEEIHHLFITYWEAIIAKDWDGARALATGPASHYATMTEQLDRISSQPAWQLQTATEPDCCEVISLDDETFVTEAAFAWTGDSLALAAQNPVAVAGPDGLVLETWGDPRGDASQPPPLGARLQDLSSGDVGGGNPDGCSTGYNWAYVPGGTDPSETVRIIVIGHACHPDEALTPLVDRARMLFNDQTEELQPTAVLWETQPDALPAGSTTQALMVFDVPRSVAEGEMIAELVYEPASSVAMQIWTMIEPFALS